MASEERNQTAQTPPHSLRLEERQRLFVSGVQEVVEFNEDAVSVKTVKGLLHVRGSGLKVEKLEKVAGELSISGLVTDLGYEEVGTQGGFWSRLFH